MADKRISQLIERTDIANNDVLPIVASGATTTNKVTISTIQNWMQENLDVGVTSVGLSMPSAFIVSASPITTSGNISVTGAGTASQYIRGDGTLADFPQGGGGGASVSYYLNGSVSQGTIGGIAYREMNKTPILGTGTDFSISSNGYIASFITDAGDPALLEIPAGNWNFETYLEASSGGGTPTFYIELYKVDSGGTATLIASNSATPESISLGTNINPYFSAIAVPQTTLLVTDRLAIRIYVTAAGRTITLHTENSHLCQIITTFTTGLTALNGLTAQVQNFATGTSGTDFNISSTGSIHTFNIPSASATNRGLLSSADWSTFNGKQNSITLTTSGTSGAATLVGSTLNIPNYSTGVANAYVPYVGAIGSVTLGYNSLSASQINIDGASPTGGSYLGFKHSTSVNTGTDGYTSMYTFGTNTIAFKSVSGGNSKDFSFSMVGITPNVAGGRQYTLPDASGTIALTSNLSSYLPLSGGTLTGALNGTTASFSGNVTSTGGNFRLFNGYYITAKRADGVDINVLGFPAGSNNLTSVTPNDYNLQNTGGQNLFSVSSTGAATFSSSVTTGGAVNLESNESYVNLFSTSTVGMNARARFRAVGAGGGSGFGGDFRLDTRATNNVWNTDVFVVNSSGNVGIGTTSPSYALDVNGSTNVSSTNFYRYNGDTGIFGSGSSITGGTASQLGIRASSDILFATNGATERMRITSGGFLKASNTGSYQGISNSFHELRTNIGDEWAAIFGNSSASPYGILLRFPGASPNGGANYFLECIDSTTSRLRIASNGNVTNVNNSYGALSDIKLKENIEDATPKLDDLMKVKVRNYNLIGEDKKQIGVIAQELEEVFPAMIDESEDFEEVDVPQVDEEGNEILNEEGEVVTTKERISKGTTTKSVKYSVFVPMLIKAMQEQQEQIKSLTEQVEALKSQING